jgi:hypothetical protein
MQSNLLTNTPNNMLNIPHTSFNTQPGNLGNPDLIGKGLIDNMFDDHRTDTINRLIDINNNSYFKKQQNIKYLISFIYFLLYSMFIGLLYSLTIINLNYLMVLFVFGVVILLFSFVSSSNDILSIYKDGGQYSYSYVYNKFNKCKCKKDDINNDNS